MSSSVARRLTTGLVSISVLFSSAAASAAAAPSASAISPWAALSALGTQSSRTALCAGAAAATAAAAAAQAAPARPGCVLPVVDQAPQVVQPEPVAPLPPVVESGGIGISPLILGLGALALAGLIYLIASDDESSPSSPN